MILTHDFSFSSKHLKGVEFSNSVFEIKDSRCKIKAGAKSDGATLARDENAYYTWFWHDNAYEFKDLKLSRFKKDLIMKELLEYEKFRWFRYSWIRKGKGFNTIWLYFIGVRAFGWIFEK